MATKLKKQSARLRPRKMKDLMIEVENARISRREDWAERLHALIESRKTAPFAWGAHDCCLWVCDCILTMTGHDPAAENFRGQYSDALGAARLLKKLGGVEAIAEKQCAAAGFAAVPVAFAQRGDVALADLGDANAPTGTKSPALGIVESGHGVFPVAVGLQWVPLALCRRTWRVG